MPSRRSQCWRMEMHEALREAARAAGAAMDTWADALAALAMLEGEDG